jgi:hypothetical protein
MALHLLKTGNKDKDKIMYEYGRKTEGEGGGSLEEGWVIIIKCGERNERRR